MRRLADDWKLLLSVFIGIAISTTLAAGTPVYLDSLGQLSFRASLDAVSSPVLDVSVSGTTIPLTRNSLQQAERTLTDAVARHISPFYVGLQTFLRGGISVVGLPRQPLPEGGGSGITLSRGFMQHISNLEQHARFVEGRVATGVISPDERGVMLEAAVSAQTAEHFNLTVGDLITLAPRLEVANVISVEIVGILEPADASRDLWAAAPFALDPAPLTTPAPLLVQTDPNEPPVALFVAEEAMAELAGDLEMVEPFGQDIYFRGTSYLAGFADRPLPEGGGEGIIVQMGRLQHLSDLERNGRFVDGRMSGDEVSMGPNGPVLEAVISRISANVKQLNVGDVIVLSPTLGARPVISAKIVGIVEAGDPSDAYWSTAGVFLVPSQLAEDPPLLAQNDPDVFPLPLFVTREAMIEALAQSYPTSLVRPIWTVLIDKESLKAMPVAEARRRLGDFQQEVTAAMPGTEVGADAVQGLTEVGEKRNFFARVPMLLVLAVMVATVLVFLLMMVSYLVQSREKDAALMRSRGAGTMQLLRLYAVEGAVMTAVAVVLAPFLAIAMIALAGLVPPFREMTDGKLIPVVLRAEPFLVATGVGLVCLAIFVVPGVVSVQGGILLHRLRASRPPSLPLLHRYHLDVALLVLGGLAFWELRQRGQIISGGLFTEVEVNETLLLAPVLFLVAVALVFIRMFPLVMRYISGESARLVHLLAGLSVLALGVGLAVRDTVAGDAAASAGPVALVLAAAVTYWATNRTSGWALRAAGGLVQAGLIAGFVVLEPPNPDEPLFAPTLVLIGVVPAQIVFLLLKALAGVSPVWLVMGLRHMARNPLRYTWLVLLLVLVTGLAVLGTTVGGTLERSQRERIRYDVAADIRVAASGLLVGGTRRLRQQFEDIPGITTVSPAFRGQATVGESFAEVFAVETDRFSDISWYREDFSERSLSEVMSRLRPAKVERIAIPDAATSIGAWIKPLNLNPFLSLHVQLEDANGRPQTVTLGNLGPPEWTLMRGRIPADVVRPLELVSVLIFQPGGFESPGTILVDDIHVAVGASGERQVLEDFEGEMRWSPILTAAIPAESIAFESVDVFGGAKAGSFSFGNTSILSFQGFYYSQTPGPLPMAVSSSLAAATGSSVSSTMMARINRRWIPVVISDVVDYFPTLAPDRGGFAVTDLDALMVRLNVLTQSLSTSPSEFFIGHAEGGGEAVQEALGEVLGRSGQIKDGTEQLEALARDPYVTAGWRPMTLLAPGIAVLAVAVGYVTFLLLFARQTGDELSSLRSFGLSSLQQMGLLAFEHLTIAAMGVGVGLWAGFQMSRLMVSPLAVTETGDPVVPPFILTTDWSLMLPTLVVILAVFVGALFTLNRSISRLDLHTVARMRAGEA